MSMQPQPVLSRCRHLSSVLGNKFDHGAEAIMPTIFNLIPNSAKIMATSGVVAVRLIIRVSVSWGNPWKKRVGGPDG